MKIIFGLLCLSTCLLYANPAISQADTLSVNSLSIKFSPQHLLVNGYHLELEKSLPANNRHSLIASPRLYYGNTATVDMFNDRDGVLDEMNRVKGYGLALQHRVYLSEQKLLQHGMYVAYGLDYHRFNVDFERRGYRREVDEDGVEYYKYRQRNFREIIDRTGIVGMGGLQVTIIHHRLFADISLGIGYRKSYIETDYLNPLFNVGTTDFGYTGSYVLAQLKFGIPL